jgi:preprotein translocase subunit SecD
MQNRYSIGKNVLLVFLLIIAVIYALPNLYGEDLAIQISRSSSAAASTASVDLYDQMKKVLADNKVEYTKIERQHDDNILVRFPDEDAQIKARDIIKGSLGGDYIVALNLASRTPKWLEFMGAYPMKRGLDLRGGVRFLLAIDLNDMVKKQEDGDSRTITSELREAGIRYVGIERVHPHGLSIAFRDQASLEKGETELSKHLRNYLFTKITTGGVFKLQVLMSEKAIFDVAGYAIEQTITTLRNRVNELGIGEAIVQREGANHISIEIPGVQDPARAKEIIGKTATLRFHLVDMDHDAEAAALGDMPLGSKLYEHERRKVLLKDQAILRGDSITYAAASMSQEGRPAVSVHLGGGGESTFHRVTSENIGKLMAIVYVETKPEEQKIDGKIVTINRQIERIISVATIQSALGNQFQITGLGNEKYAQDLSLLLRSGALGAPVSFAQEFTIGPSMGKANISKGIMSVIVGYLFVMFFMVFYYRFFGLISSLAFFLNLVFMTAILSILGAVLTLPGIAGMVLTVGMAVDASILIYERIREELRNGISAQASIYTGYERAFTTIVDANVATLIVAIVLYALGSGPVKAFAVVLTIGLMTSMLTSIMFTRAIVNWLYGSKNVKKLSIGI